jgi:quercetin dioxygenase-like cupin family protein
MAEDAVKIAPHVYKSVLENARVRVLEIRTEPGQTSELHSHPDMVLYAVTDCDWLLTGEDGESMEARIPQGQTIFLDATTHRAEDIGTGGSFAIAVELQ